MYIANDKADEEIVSEILETRNPQLFELIYERHVNRIYNKCLDFAGDKLVAEDLTHDVFLKAYINLKSFQGKSKFYTWLYALCYNYCIDYYKSKKKEKEELENYSRELAIADDDMSDAALLNIQFERLRVVLEKIPLDDKVILLMKYQDDFSLDEICQSMNLGLSAVKMRLKRAKEKVMNEYDNLYGSETRLSM